MILNKIKINNDTVVSVDNTPINESSNLVKSGGVADLCNTLKYEIGIGVWENKSVAAKHIYDSTTRLGSFVKKNYALTLKSGYCFRWLFYSTNNNDIYDKYINLNFLSSDSYICQKDGFLVISKPDDSIISPNEDFLDSYKTLTDSAFDKIEELDIKKAFVSSFLLFEKENIFSYGWELGVILEGGYETHPNDDFYYNRLRTLRYFSLLNNSITCDIDSGYGYRIEYYSTEDNWLSQVVLDSGGSYTGGVPSNANLVRFVVLKTDNTNIIPSDMDDVNFTVSGIDKSDYIESDNFSKPLYPEDIQDISTTIKTDINEYFIDFDKQYFIDPNWQQGGITANGLEPVAGQLYYDNRIKTGTYYYSSDNATITVAFDSGYNARVMSYSGTGGQSDFITFSEMTSGSSFTASNGVYYRFVLYKSNGSNILPEEGTHFEVVGFDEPHQTDMFIYKRPAYLSDISGEYIKNKKLIGARVSFLGDSITLGAGATSQLNTYHGVFCSLYNAIDRTAEILNERGSSSSDLLGMNGTCIADNTKNGLGSKRFVTRATAENFADSKLIVVFGGTNDLSYDRKAIGDLFVEETIEAYGNMGTKHLTVPTDTETFAGALHNLITTIQTACPKVPIVFMTPLKRDHNSATNPDYLTCNTNGDFMIDFVNAIKEICAFYSIPVLDLYSDSLLNPLAPGWSSLFGDGLHPNNQGHSIIGNLLFKFVEENVIIP